MSNVNTTTKNNGTPFATEAPPLLDSSIAPPVSMVMPSGKLAFISVNFASTWFEATGACIPPFKLARTVIEGTRLRRQITPSSNV